MTNTIRRIQTKAVFILCAIVIMSIASAAHATSGVMYVYGTKTLTANHYGTIVLASDNAKIDCDGHTIYYGSQASSSCGPAANESCGIKVVGIDNPYVFDCNVQNFDIGLYVDDSTDLTVRESTFKNNNDGIYLEYTDNGYGYYIMNNSFKNNTDEGIVLRSSNRIRMFYNDVWDNDSDGADIEHSDDLEIYSSAFDGNGRNGCELDYVDDAEIRYNWFGYNGVVTNDHSGLSLDDSNRAQIHNNRFIGNKKSGVRLTSNSDGGTVANNVGYNNRLNDAHQSSNSSNTWYGNDFDVTSGL